MNIVENKVSVKIGGPAGSGVMTLGLLMEQAFKNSGLWCLNDTDYPSLIKGGHNLYHIDADEERNYSLYNDKCDLLIALDKLSVDLHKESLTEKGGIIFDPEDVPLDKKDLGNRKDIVLYPVEFKKLTEHIGNKRYYNTIAFGASAAVLNISFDVLTKLLRKQFKKKGESVVQDNINAAKKGYDYVKKKFPFEFKCKITRNSEEEKRVLMTGNEAIAIGAIRGGVKFYAAYPMTPATSILHYMAAQEENKNIVVKQTEDELAAINTIIGACMTGVRAMCATSGGGFALMTEALGMAGVNETNPVIVESQRGGTSTGLPTYTEQADLRFVLHASQGEFPRIVMAPGDIEEAFYETVNVLNYAEICQVPAIILVDKYFSANHFMAPMFDTKKAKVIRGRFVTEEEIKKAGNFKRYAFTKDGISPRSVPGQKNGMYVCSSYEHDETGATTEESEMTVKMVNKRAKKLEVIPKEIYAPRVYGSDKPDLTMFVWGSTKMPAMEALRLLEKENKKVRLVHLPYILPFPKEEIKRLIKEGGKTLIIEGNSEGQLRGFIREQTLMDVDESFLKYDCRAFNAEEIIKEVKRLL